MKIIIRYTFREILEPFFLALLAFTSVLLVDKIFDLTKFFVEKGVNPWYMVEMLFYFSPAVFVLTVPMAFLVGIVTAFGRLASDNEITAIKNAGVGMHRLIVPVVTVSLVLSVFMVLFMDFTIPRGNKAYTSLSNDIRRKHPALVLEPNTIMQEMSGEGKKWYFKNLDPGTGRMKSIRIWERISGTMRLIVAEEGELKFFDEWTSLKLYNGSIYQSDRKDPLKGYVVGNFNEDDIILDISGSLDRDQETQLGPRNMSMKEIRVKLEEFIEQMKSPNITPGKKDFTQFLINGHRVELYKKISIPFACLAFGLIGVPLGLMVRRGGRMIGLGVGVGVITLYYVVLTAGEKLAKQGLCPPSLGAWTPNILTFIAGMILIIRTIRETPIRSSRWINKLFPPKEYRHDSGVIQ